MNTPNNRNDFYKEQLGKTLNGNEKIETAIAALQKESTEEMLAHTLTVIRHRMQEQAQLIIAVRSCPHLPQILIKFLLLHCKSRLLRE